MPALLFAIFRKTRTQCLLGRTENNHGTLVGIVGFRAGMKHKTFRICCTQHHSMATCHHIIICAIEFFLLLHLQACSHTTQLPPPPSYFTCKLHLQSLPLPLQRQSTVSPPRQLEYYAVVWGVTKVRLKEKGLRSAD